MKEFPMKAGDLVIRRRKGEKAPGVLVDIIESNVFGGDAIVTVLWAGQSRALKTMRSSLQKVNP
jgi:hypothetical protein